MTREPCRMKLVRTQLRLAPCFFLLVFAFFSILSFQAARSAPTSTSSFAFARQIWSLPSFPNHL